MFNEFCRNISSSVEESLLPPSLLLHPSKISAADSSKFSGKAAVLPTSLSDIAVLASELKMMSWLPTKAPIFWHQWSIYEPNQPFSINFVKNHPENQARGNRKTLKRPKMMSKINFRNLKLKSHEEYLIYRTYFVK